MIASTPSYHEPTNLTASLPSEFVGVPTSDLLAWLEMYGDQRLRALDGEMNDAPLASTLGYLEYRQDRVLDELERRRARLERHRDDPRAPRWPSRARYAALTELARDLKAKYPLENFVADQVMATQLRRTGSRWRGNCPIPDHDDTTPSFTVYPDGRWHCFGCGRSGDVYTLIGLVHGLERFSDQVAFLATCYGHEVAS